MRSYLKFALAIVGLVVAPVLFMAQVPSAPLPPYNQDLGAVLTLAVGPGNAGLGSNTAAQVNSSSQNNLAFAGVMCTYVQTASSGSPSTTFTIQGFDAASGTWNSLVTSSAITNPGGAASPWMIAAGRGLIAADAPTNGTQKANFLPRTWRVGVNVNSTNSVTGTVGCNYIR